ncbi:MAG: hypothetical protein M5R40_07085 [Anaerolineae bacterium]|nr:hypothetical protein [Anaerolineae bacterium]
MAHTGCAWAIHSLYWSTPEAPRATATITTAFNRFLKARIERRPAGPHVGDEHEELRDYPRRACAGEPGEHRAQVGQIDLRGQLALRQHPRRAGGARQAVGAVQTGRPRTARRRRAPARRCSGRQAGSA